MLGCSLKGKDCVRFFKRNYKINWVRLGHRQKFESVCLATVMSHSAQKSGCFLVGFFL